MPEKPKSTSRLAKLSGIGFELVAAVGGFTLIGYWWDRYFGTRPWGTLIGALLGLTGGMYNLIRQSLVAVRESAPGTKTMNGDEEQ